MNKLSVATRSGVLSKNTQSIIKCMQSYPEGITPKKISLLTSINVNTVKSIIPKLADIQKIGRGFYKVYNGGTVRYPQLPTPYSIGTSITALCRVKSLPEQQ